jgi:hypothetical protein
VASTTGSSKSSQRPPHPEGNQPGEEQRGDLAAEPKRSGKRVPGRRSKTSGENGIPSQATPESMEDLGEQEATAQKSLGEEGQKLILPSTKPAERGPKIAVALFDFINEPLREGVKVSEQTRLIEARTTALTTLATAATRTIGFACLFATLSVLAITGFSFAIHALLPGVSLKEAVAGTVSIYILGVGAFATAVRVMRGGKGKG